MLSLSKEQSILSRETIQNALFSELCPFLTYSFYPLSCTPQRSFGTCIWCSCFPTTIIKSTKKLVKVEKKFLLCCTKCFLSPDRYFILYLFLYSLLINHVLEKILISLCRMLSISWSNAQNAVIDRKLMMDDWICHMTDH